MIIAGLQFVGGAILVIFAGVTLTKNAETLGKTLGLSASWAGILILPLATSLPELVSSLRAVLITAPDLAVGNLFGSNLFNLAIIALVDLVQGKGSLLYRLKDGHIMSASLSLVLLAIAGLGLLIPLPVIMGGWISLNSFLLMGCYLAASKLITSYEARNIHDNTTECASAFASPKKALLRFIAAAAVILVAGTYLTDASEIIALETGLGRTFVGSIFLAIATSLPEVVTTSTAARYGKFDMAVGNIFGANMYNMFILGLVDLAYSPGNLFNDSSIEHLLTILMCIALTSLVTVGLANRSIKALGPIGYDSMIIVMGYLIAIVVLFYMRVGL